MHFVVICRDKKDSAQIRLDARPDHVAFLKGSNGAIQIAGPILDDQNDGMIGSVLIVEANDRNAVEALLAKDPYKAVDLFQSVEILPWKWVLGAPKD
ncbi:MAG: YciI family protein [Cohaesibacteraceae bacterium]|nr:YciI family protein [Cohaesibacteraceae bacterium]